MSSHDEVTNPAHYTAGRSIEPLDAIRDWKLDYLLGQVVKYVSRAGRKDAEIKDLKKARFYLDRRILELTPSGDRPQPHPSLPSGKEDRQA